MNMFQGMQKISAPEPATRKKEMWEQINDLNEQVQVLKKEKALQKGNMNNDDQKESGIASRV